MAMTREDLEVGKVYDYGMCRVTLLGFGVHQVFVRFDDDKEQCLPLDYFLTRFSKKKEIKVHKRYVHWYRDSRGIPQTYTHCRPTISFAPGCTYLRTDEVTYEEEIS